MYIDKAERAWKNDTNPPIHEKVKYIKNTKQFRTHPVLVGHTLKMSKNYFGMVHYGCDVHWQSWRSAEKQHKPTHT